MLHANDHVLEQVDAYLHDLLTAKDAETLERHCAECRICQVAMEEARRRFEALRGLPEAEVPQRLIQETWAKIERHRRRRLTPALVGWAAAAVFLVMFAGLHVYYLTLSPSPYDLKILGQSELIAQSGASLRVLLVDHDSGRPIADAPVEIDLADGKTNRMIHLVSFKTDRWGSGSPHFTLPNWKSGEYELRVSARPGGARESIARTVKLKRSWRLMLTSDKPVYQPGQVIHVRSLAMAQPELKPVAGHNVAYSIRDPKGNVIFRKQDVTSRFGIASADCPLADEITEGAYQIECRVGDTASSLTVEVKKYVLPKFKIDVSLDQPYYQPGQKVRGTVAARYFFGKPVQNAEVEIAAGVRDVGANAVGRLQRRTGAAGSADFEFTVPERLFGREQLSGNAEISIRATVVDSAGQKGVRTIYRIVTDQPIRVEVIPESGALVRGIANVVYLFTSYPDGRPARTRISVSGIHRELVSSPLGVARVELTPEAEQVFWTVRAVDDAGRVGRREVVLECGKAADDFLVRTDAAVYDGGKTMHVLALGSGNEPVFLDLIKDGQTMLTDMIPMSKGTGQYDFDLPPGLFGTLELSAYRYGAAGLPVRKTQVIYVRPADAVKIETTLDRQEYRPGGRAKISFRLTDEQNRPLPGALSLAAVDEAVFSVLGQRPGMEGAFFTLEQELLQPVYALYPWSPNMLPGAAPADRAGLEKALFSRAAQKPLDRDALLAELVKKYGEGNKEMLEVLNRPDLDQLLDHVVIPDELKALLRDNTGTYTLEGTTYPAQVQKVERERKETLATIKAIWVCLGIIGGIVFLIVVLPKLGASLVEVLVVITICAILCASDVAGGSICAGGQQTHASQERPQTNRPGDGKRETSGRIGLTPNRSPKAPNPSGSANGSPRLCFGGRN